MSASPLLGRCKDCTFTVFATDEDVQDGESFKDVRPGTAHRVGNNGVFSRCHNNHRVFLLKRIKGTYSPDHKCDSRCLNARGAECTCSCGGANHGRGHAVAVVQAKSDERYTVGTEHIGEIGKIIRGMVEVDGIKPIGNGSTLYTFLTDKNAVIKWFAPKFADPHFEQGDRFEIRAKVKAHEDNQFGKSTIVTYVTVKGVDYE